MLGSLEISGLTSILPSLFFARGDIAGESELNMFD
jgi:hypothetical protein